MNLAHFVHAYPERTETFISRQVDGLAARGHRVVVFTHGPPQGLDPDTAARARIVRLDAPRANGASALRRSARTALAAATSAARHPRLASEWLAQAGGTLRRRIETLHRAPVLAREGPFDIAHCHYGDVGLADLGAARVWRAPLVVSFYGYDCSSFVRGRGAAVYAPLFASADRILALGETMRARLEALGAPPERLAIQPLGVDPDVFRPAQGSPAGSHLLTVARLVPKKGIDVALRAVALLAPEFPDLRYEIVGDGPLRPELEALSSQLGIARLVEFAGMRSQEEVRRALGRASLFVLPSRTAPDGDEEGTPTVLLEAASAGLPVVSTRHAGIPDVVADGETGFLVEESDVEALGASLRDLLARGELRARMGRAGRRRVLRVHDTARLSARLERHYEEASRNAARRFDRPPRDPKATSS